MSGLSTGTKIAYIVIGIISCIAGIWLFMYPGVEEQVLGMVMGWLMIFYGIMAICSYFAADALKPILKFNIWIGILLIVFGIVLLSNIHATMNFLGILVGIFLIFDAALSFWLAFELKNTGMKDGDGSFSSPSVQQCLRCSSSLILAKAAICLRSWSALCLSAKAQWM